MVSRIGRNVVFSSPKCGKFAHTKLGTLETWISRLGKIAFSGLKNEENFHTLRAVTRNVGFTNRQKSLFQAAQMRKICSHEARYTWTESFTTAKIEYWSPQNAENDLTRK